MQAPSGRDDGAAWGGAGASVAWLYTAMEDCALDSEAFASFEPEIDRAIWAAIGSKLDGPPQGVQAAVEVLGDEWRRQKVPEHINNPSLLLPPFLGRLERDNLLRDVTDSVIAAVDTLAATRPTLFRDYAGSVEQTMRARLLQQIAIEHDERSTRRALQASAQQTMGAALAALWREQPRLRQEHLPLLRGHQLPPALRAHVWQHSLGGDKQAERVGARVQRQMHKDGIASATDLDAAPLAAVVRRAAQELFSERRALQTHDLSSPASVSIAVRVLLRVSLLSGTQSGGGASSAEGLGASTRRLQRWLLILAPILVVFPPPKDVAEEHLVDWLGKLVAADEVVPTSSSVRALARDVGRQVRSADPAFSDSISALWRKGEMAGGGGGRR